MLILHSTFDVALAILAAFTALITYYIYDGYLRLLQILSLFRPRPNTIHRDEPLSITVLIAVYNEAEKVKARVENIFSDDFPRNSLQVIVASDGSTDSTDDIVRELGPSVLLIRTEGRLGKSATQNAAIAHATGDAIVFTDAETVFDRGFLRAIVAPLSDGTIGGVDGRLLPTRSTGKSLGPDQAAYWAYEDKLRIAESRLGILAVASGACMSVRRRLFRPLPSDVGEDCIIPLDVVSQGFKYVKAPDARAYETFAQTPSQELKRRVRMTLRNWRGTWAYPALLNPFGHCGYALALWSHKVLRWLSPIFLIALFTSIAILSIRRVIPPPVSLTMLAVFLALTTIGLLAHRARIRIPLASQVASFLIANLGFLGGLLSALMGKRVVSYK